MFFVLLFLAPTNICPMEFQVVSRATAGNVDGDDVGEGEGGDGKSQ